ncbi:Mdm31p NDAI_0D03310 [Naumovozyma dairenensis CBS 421]|uniref:Mitochondrial distribution and morphology protein 31 n=1 Tax=Naumovozyma dairenensis (strain ATCC 10597 / BCRC 20456 / CBS 421 / NBRC 0211 / NRRL Y-12639) TaxID=1071378 RepID=G0WA34_NAUDC|nr:hypothetical protein NDAI_0D03310 [Naumovozyma dairenensis CBS 421]CCD24645.1 hypothetical protein NDAI_0D03310 [Naumovozyma dairenensis CBS 421]
MIPLFSKGKIDKLSLYLRRNLHDIRHTFIRRPIVTTTLYYNNNNRPGLSSTSPQLHNNISYTFLHSRIRYIHTPKSKGNDSPHDTSNTLQHLIAEKNRRLSQATNIFQKLKINIRWILKKSYKPFNADDISAVISWVLVSNVIIFILWTTTFVSLIIYLLNSISLQDYLVKSIGNLITRGTPNLSVIFEDAIVPDWSSGKIIFKNVFVSRRPKLLKGFQKGSQEDAVQRANLALTEKNLLFLSPESSSSANENDWNYTQFDLTIDKVEISLNFTKWLNGKGCLDEVSINGLRGIVDRTHIRWKDNDDPRDFRNVYQLGDFEISKFSMNDGLFTLYQPNGFRPFQVSIFNCDLPQLRKHWLFYDILKATNVSGTYDNSMFTIHRTLQNTNTQQEATNDNNNNNDSHHGDSPPWRKITRLRVDNLDVEHLNRGIEGPFGWIRQGQVDMVGDVLLPDKEADKSEIKAILAEIGDRFLNEAKKLSSSSTTRSSRDTENTTIDPEQYFIMKFFLKLKNVKAEVPLFPSELNYINGTLIRPIVGYINSRRTYIPIECKVIKNVADFEGSWTIYDSYLMKDLSAEVYDAFAKYVADQQQRKKRFKRISFWSLQMLIQLVLMSVGTIA